MLQCTAFTPAPLACGVKVSGISLRRPQSRGIAATLVVLLSILSGCASLVPQTMSLRNAWPPGVPERTELTQMPFFSQQDYQCGPAALATTLVNSGIQTTPESLAVHVYLPARQGSLQSEMLAAARRYNRVSYQLTPRLDDLLREVAAGNPVIVLQDTGVGPVVNWHYAVVIGYDYPAGELYLRSGDRSRLAIPFTVFEYTWKKSNYWAMLTMPPDRIPVTATAEAYLNAVTAMERVGEAWSATMAYTTLLRRWPDNAVASIGLANQYYAKGELDSAESVLRNGALENPDSVPLLNNLAHTLSDLGRNEEALPIIEQAIKPSNDPFSAIARETQSLILQRMGKNQ